MFPFLKKPKRYLKISKNRKSKKKVSINWQPADDIYADLKTIVAILKLNYVDLTRIKTFRSFGSTSGARARIWAFPRIWQQALNLPAHYIIEVLAEKFDHLSLDDKKRVLIHELMHIPKSFSGSLVAHRGRYHRINSRSVEQLFNLYKKSTTGI